MGELILFVLMFVMLATLNSYAGVLRLRRGRHAFGTVCCLTLAVLCASVGVALCLVILRGL